MGYTELSIKLPTNYQEGELRASIKRILRFADFSFHILNKSLDARQKKKIHWLIRVSVVSPEISGGEPDISPPLEIPFRKRPEKALVVGSGPAGFFAASVLQRSGIQTTLIERGSEVAKRAGCIREFEKDGVFDELNNYSFGEGGAGTFSDGKLTSRTKNISRERQFVLQSYIEAGAPPEIAYLAHPHLGSDNLRKIVRNLREDFIQRGGQVLFETMLTDLQMMDGKVSQAVTDSGGLEADYFVLAPGQAAFETYRMLISRGVQFRTKRFAIGSRVEHHQSVINRAQWGKEQLPGVKASEYRLTSSGAGGLPVYTFCMCPGGIIVPSTAYAETNIVNGMSLYARSGQFANSACVAGIDLQNIIGKELSASEALDWLEKLEHKFYEYSNGYSAPFCSIRDFINQKEGKSSTASSYPLGLKHSALWELFPPSVSAAIRQGLRDFSKKIQGFDTGNIMGLESKTSSPIQVLRDNNSLYEGFENLYMVGEGSGYAGGIISSAVNGIKAAMHIAGHECKRSH
ncbi:FAD-dependent monooxygenase [bacterium]|nr:FAD-dependent monooxygenase [bacterium]